MVHELQKSGDGKVNFEVITATKAELAPLIEPYDLGDTHGLVALDSDGNIVTKLPGHDYGQLEVEDALKQIQPR